MATVAADLRGLHGVILVCKCNSTFKITAPLITGGMVAKMHGQGQRLCNLGCTAQ